MIGKAIASVVLLVALVPVLFTAAGAAMLGGFDDGAAVAESGAVEAPTADYGVIADPTALAEAVLNHPRIGLRAPAVDDVRAGRVDDRVLAVLLRLARYHSLGSVGPFVTKHDYFVRDDSGNSTGRPSNHVFGRAVDVATVDGMPVSPTNDAARDVVALVISLEPELRPSEIGCPWPELEGITGVFSNRAHRDHLHLGFDR